MPLAIKIVKGHSNQCISDLYECTDYPPPPLPHPNTQNKKNKRKNLSSSVKFSLNYTTLLMSWKVGVNHSVHWFPEGKSLGIQQGTSEWIGSPRSAMEHALFFKLGSLLHSRESNFSNSWFVSTNCGVVELTVLACASPHMQHAGKHANEVNHALFTIIINMQVTDHGGRCSLWFPSHCE